MVSEESIDPYELGLRASAENKPVGDNPYMPGTAAYQEWALGYAAGEEDWAALCAREVAEGRPHPDAP